MGLMSGMCSIQEFHIISCSISVPLRHFDSLPTPFINEEVHHGAAAGHGEQTALTSVRSEPGTFQHFYRVIADQPFYFGHCHNDALGTIQLL
jgi:hypothetical protein